MKDDLKQAVDSLVEPADPSIFVASNGVRFKLKRTSNMLMLEAARRVPVPQPPRTFNEDKGRDEENPNDPQYVVDLRNYNYDLGMLTADGYFALGTSLLLPLPDGVEPPGGDEWAETLTAVSPDLDIPEKGPRRYLAWLKFYALPDSDQQSLMRAVVRLSSAVLEADVAKALSTFPSDAARDSTDAVPTATQSGRGDRDGIDPGNGAGVRGAGSSRVRPLLSDGVAGPGLG